VFLKISDNHPLFITQVCILLYNVSTQVTKDKISQLADDTTLFMSSKTDIVLAMNEIEIFGSFSGLILIQFRLCTSLVLHMNWLRR
jgi:hypothetical protein